MSLTIPRSYKYLLCWLLTATLLLFATVNLAAQSTTTGDVSGVVSDPSGAVVPGATVTLKNIETGRTSTTTTNNAGTYRFSLLAPGPYSITISSPNFSPATVQVAVPVGQAVSANIHLQLSGTQQVVEVTAEGSNVQSDNGNISTTFSQALIENQPNPGNDLTYLAQTSPGAVMNTQSGYGNFSAFGLPGTSNLFTSNGMNDNDPFLNLNNSGATNQMLGTNDAREVTVVNNGYSVEYGGMAGSNVNIVSKSGTNQYHGNAQYFYNWDGLNANNWFNDASGVPKPHAVANQWAASFGGPIRKDKSFFFVNTEGLYLAIPTSTVVPIPSPAFQAATLASIPASQVPTYTKIFSLYNNAPGASRAASLTPDVNQFRSTVGNHTHEWIISGRYDQNLGANDRAFVHFRMDRGLQATYTDPVSPAFNIQSFQPQYEGQVNLNHTFGSNAVNQFILAGSYYRAIFTVPNEAAAMAEFPFNLNFVGLTFFGIGGNYPLFFDSNQNGRNVTQYQINDDYSRHWRNHDLKFGIDFVRNDITDFRLLTNSLFGLEPGETLADFQAGLATLGYTQQFPSNGRQSAPLAMYNLGLYAQDEFRVLKNLKLTIGLRADHYSNPVCQINCFSRFPGNFDAISHNPAQPYNQALLFGQHQALNSFDAINWSPRLGFAWTPIGARSSFVVRGGIGLFFDRFPGTAVDALLLNTPFNNGFVVGTKPTVPVLLSAAPATAAAANTAFLNGFASGGTAASIGASNPFFAPPSLYNPGGSLHAPQYQEWNLEIEKGIGSSMTFSINYVGNHGLHETWGNFGPNGFDPNGFGGLPLTAPDPRFSTVQEIQTSAVSNYNGVTVSLSRRLRSFQFQFNYTWSHALDEISNGGLSEPFSILDNISVVTAQNPFNLRQFNYGNADYDTRHYASLNYVWTTPKMKNSWMSLLADWTIAGNLFTRTGYPFTVVDSAVSSTLSGQNFYTGLGPVVWANQVRAGSFSCGPSAARITNGASSNPCPALVSGFTPTSYGPGTANTWGDQRRNQVYGPNYFNTNLTVMKNFRFPHWESAKLGVGAQFFNILNHPNFDQPIGDIASPLFGTIQHTLNTPTSMYGAFLGADASARQIQLRATLNF